MSALNRCGWRVRLIQALGPNRNEQMISLRRSILAAAVGVSLVVYGGFQPDEYLIHVLHVTDPQPYPFVVVGFFASLVLVASLVLYAVLRWPKSLDPFYRLLFAFLLFGTWTCLLVVMSMHQASHYFGYLVWTFMVTVCLVVALIASLFKRRPSA